MSTETRDALREALAEALRGYEVRRYGQGIADEDDEPGSFGLVSVDEVWQSMVAALRATDAPVAEGLRDCPHCGRSLDPRPYDANRDEPTALATPEPDV